MFGPGILARFLTEPDEKSDKFGNRWQYHPRSDRHSKVGCWGVALDLLMTSSLLRSHVEQGKVVLGVNHKMVDHATRREKALDLVIARPREVVSDRAPTFGGLVERFKIILDAEEEAALAALPVFPIAPVGAVYIALEAKACMTEHTKALPRLYDELNSAHLCVHGSSKQALAIAYVQVNISEKFTSPLRNKYLLEGDAADITRHAQPHVTERVLKKVSEIPRRSNSSENGFDGIGVTVLDLENNGSPVTVVDGPPAPPAGDTFNYDNMIVRMGTEYDATFSRI